MKVLAFAASTSTQSINKQLVTYAVSMLADATTEVIDLNDYALPVFSVDVEQELGQPENAVRFFNKIGEADAVVISFAEHNGSYSAAYKNLFDWASRINQKVFQGKRWCCWQPPQALAVRAMCWLRQRTPVRSLTVI